MIQVGSPAYIIVSGNWKRVIELANQLKERPDTVKQFETLGWFLIGECPGMLHWTIGAAFIFPCQYCLRKLQTQGHTS